MSLLQGLFVERAPPAMQGLGKRGSTFPRSRPHPTSRATETRVAPWAGNRCEIGRASGLAGSLSRPGGSAKWKAADRRDHVYVERTDTVLESGTDEPRPEIAELARVRSRSPRGPNARRGTSPTTSPSSAEAASSEGRATAVTSCPSEPPSRRRCSPPRADTTRAYYLTGNRPAYSPLGTIERCPPL